MHRGEVITVHVESVDPNPWNPNEQQEHVFEAEQKSIKKHGLISFPVVRETKDGRFQILDGEHRWRAVQATGGDEISVLNLGTEVSTVEAKMITEQLNALRGRNDPIKHAELLDSIISEKPEWKEMLAYTPDHLESLLNPTFDWESLDRSDQGRDEEGGGSGADSGFGPQTELKIQMSEEQHEVVMRAIAHAKDVGDCESDARAMELICADFLAS